MAIDLSAISQEEYEDLFVLTDEIKEMVSSRLLWKYRLYRKQGGRLPLSDKYLLAQLLDESFQDLSNLGIIESFVEFSMELNFHSDHARLEKLFKISESYLS